VGTFLLFRLEGGGSGLIQNFGTYLSNYFTLHQIPEEFYVLLTMYPCIIFFKWSQVGAPSWLRLKKIIQKNVVNRNVFLFYSGAQCLVCSLVAVHFQHWATALGQAHAHPDDVWIICRLEELHLNPDKLPGSGTG